MPVMTSPRLRMERLSLGDAGFMLDLLNQPTFLRFIGDRQVRTLAEAEAYLRDGPLASCAQHGFGLYRRRLKATGAVIGICGLVRRDGLADVDLGFALLPEFCAQGLATEAAAATLAYARDQIGLQRVVAIVTAENAGSIRVLEKIGMRFETTVRLHADSEELRLFGLPLTTSTSAESPAAGSALR